MVNSTKCSISNSLWDAQLSVFTPINDHEEDNPGGVSGDRLCLDRDDLAQAVRYLGLLRGEPRLVAADWLREARLLLEARQAADALLAHAAATGLQALGDGGKP